MLMRILLCALAFAITSTAQPALLRVGPERELARPSDAAQLARDGDVLIEHSEFAHNGFGDGYGHNLYSSYAIDLPNGGHSYVIGNLIHQGPAPAPSPGRPAV